VPVKGWDVLIDALARLRGPIQGRPVALVLVGDGPRRPALEAQAERLGVAGRLRFAGWVDDPAPFYALADLVVFPSRPAEALGNVILEAWAHGRPLLTTASRGANELVRPAIDAVQVPCEDAAALAAGIGALLADDAQRAALASAGRARVARDFCREAVIGAYIELYRQLLGV
jgi:glycosyltransferase involved in cell wall biosynthesis